MDLLPQQVRDIFGGELSPFLIVGALLAAYLAYKAVKFTVKLALLAAAAILFLGIVPWAGADIEGDAADCARAEVADTQVGWQEFTTKRLTVEELSDNARCAPSGTGLVGGAAVIRARSFFDLPVQTWAVDDTGARATTLTQLPTELPDLVPGRSPTESS